MPSTSLSSASTMPREPALLPAGVADAVSTGPTAAELAAQLQAAGYLPGPQAGLTAEAAAIDQRVCRRMRCPRCRARGLAYYPFHNAAGRYRVVAACLGCGAGEEV